MKIVERNAGTTLGGVTGRGFLPGQSGNPGGRPKGLAKRVRELVGNDGEAIADFMVEVMTDETARNADRIEAAKWLGDRGFGRAVQSIEIDVPQRPMLDVRAWSSGDLRTLIAIVQKYKADSDQAVLSDEMEVITLS